MWQELGIGPTHDERAIKRAYARRLKQVHPEDDPEGFQRLRSAFEAALNHAAYHAHYPSTDERGLDAEQASADTNGPVEPDATAPSVAIEATSVIDPHPWDELRQRFDTEGVQNQEADAAAEEQLEQRALAEASAPQQAHAQAREWVQPVVQAIQQQDDDAARKHLKAAFTALVELDVREAFEHELVIAFNGLEWVPATVLRAAAKHFGWGKHAEHLMHAYPGNTHLFEQLHTLDMLRRLTAGGENKGAAALAQRLLLGPYQPGSFFWHALRRRVVGSMRALLDSLQASTPSLLERYVDPRTLTWWRRCVDGVRVHWSHIGFSLIGGVALSWQIDRRVPQSQLAGVWPLVWMLLIALACYAIEYALRPYRERISAWLRDDPRESVNRFAHNLALRFRTFQFQLPAGLTLLGLTWFADWLPQPISIACTAGFVVLLLPMVLSLIARSAENQSAFGFIIFTAMLGAALTALMPSEDRNHTHLRVAAAAWLLLAVPRGASLAEHAPRWLRMLFDSTFNRRFGLVGLALVGGLLMLAQQLGSAAATNSIGALVLMITFIYAYHGRDIFRTLRGFGIVPLVAGAGIIAAQLVVAFPDQLRLVVLFALCAALAIGTLIQPRSGS